MAFCERNSTNYYTDIAKVVEDQDLQTQRKTKKVAKELFANYVKEKKLREPEEKKELAQTLKTFYVEARTDSFNV